MAYRSLGLNLGGVVPVLFGGALALLGLLIAMGLAGAGEGWDAPAQCALFLPIAYPVTTYRVFSSTPNLWLDGSLLAIGLGLDVYLAWDTYLVEYQYFLQVVGLSGLWLIIWAAWQLALALRIVQHFILTRDGG